MAENSKNIVPILNKDLDYLLELIYRLNQFPNLNYTVKRVGENIVFTAKNGKITYNLRSGLISAEYGHLYIYGCSDSPVSEFIRPLLHPEDIE